MKNILLMFAVLMCIFGVATTGFTDAITGPLIWGNQTYMPPDQYGSSFLRTCKMNYKVYSGITVGTKVLDGCIIPAGARPLRVWYDVKTAVRSVSNNTYLTMFVGSYAVTAYTTYRTYSSVSWTSFAANANNDRATVGWTVGLHEGVVLDNVTKWPAAVTKDTKPTIDVQYETPTAGNVDLYIQY